MAEASGLFTVFVKTPQDDADLAIPGLHGGVTTRDLKEAIARSHSLKPPVSNMKLIFAGRVLLDHSTLTEAFAPVGTRDSYTVHLVGIGTRDSYAIPTQSQSPPSQHLPSTTSSSSSPSSPSSPSSFPHIQQPRALSHPQVVSVNGIPYLAIPYANPGNVFLPRFQPQSTNPSFTTAHSFPQDTPRASNQAARHPNENFNRAPNHAHLPPQNLPPPPRNGNDIPEAAAQNRNQNQNWIRNAVQFWNWEWNGDWARPFLVVLRFFLFFYFFAKNMTGERFFFLCLVGSLIFVHEFGLLDPFILLRRGMHLLRPIGTDHSFMQQGPLHIAFRLFVAFFVSLLPNIEFTPFPKPDPPVVPAAEAAPSEDAVAAPQDDDGNDDDDDDEHEDDEVPGVREFNRQLAGEIPA